MEGERASDEAMGRATTADDCGYSVVAELDSARLKANRQELVARKSELQARRRLAMATMQRQSQLKNQGWSPKQRFDEARFSVQELDAGIARVDAQITALDIDIEKSV